ncbi:MAG: A/G-specific adenine glycosylase [Coxiellaceae bacterium]|nr:A/G-specific adenine glycosylase [Coxiellaceae bacterium]
MANLFSKKLLKWYETYGRHDLPWQKNQTHYRVWISEIMLQQTQVTTVIPYYERFMKDFPTVVALANAKEDEVLSHWSGLGYYARARNIHKTAQRIVTHHHGKFPTTVEAMSELPGIGKSTAGAIISFAQQEKAVILDGNVKRVLARYFAIEKPVNQSKTTDEMWVLANELTPEKNAHHYNQAIMDLGATLCTRSKPRCTDCPVQKECVAFAKNEATLYPIKTVKKARPTKKTRMLIIQNKQGEILLIKRPSKGIWGGLWSFPESDENNFQSHALKYLNELPQITHQFTHFKLIITPHRFSMTKKIDGNDLFWYKLGEKLPGGIAAPVTKILAKL